MEPTATLRALVGYGLQLVAPSAAARVPELGSFGESTGAPLGKILLIPEQSRQPAIGRGRLRTIPILPALKADHKSPDVLGEWRSTVLTKAIMLFSDEPACLGAASS